MIVVNLKIPYHIECNTNPMVCGVALWYGIVSGILIYDNFSQTFYEFYFVFLSMPCECDDDDVDQCVHIEMGFVVY